MNPALLRDDLAAGLLAAAVHVFFAVLLVVGVSWQIHNPQPVMADLWEALPPPPRPVPRAAPQPRPVPPPQAKPEPEPDTRAADIALERKKRAEQEKLKRQQAAEAEKKLREAKLKELAEAKRRADLQREEADLQRRMLEQSMAAESGQLRARAAAAQRASEVDKLVARYQDMISARIRGNTRLPDNLPGNPQVEFRLSVLPSGDIVRITLTKSSGNAAFDQAVLRGIEKSSPLPLPADRAAMEKFRDLDIKHKARE